MSKKFLSLSGIGILLVMLVLLNGISRDLFTRWYADLTADKLYSLSEGTKRVLGGIQDPITLKYYFSRTDSARFPAVKLYGTRILDLLREYERSAHGKVILEVYDPRPDSEESEWAEKYGLNPIPARSGEELLLGLAAVNALGAEQVIPVFNFARQEFLEYDITKLLYSLINTKKPVVGILSSLNLAGQGPELENPAEGGGEWFFHHQLSQLADVRTLKSEMTSVEDDVDLLLVIHPKSLPDAALYAIDQYVMHGRKVIVLEDPFCQADNPKPDPQNPMAGMMAERSSSLNKLLTTWGVKMDEKKAVADIGLATKVDTGRGGGTTTFPLWLSVRAQNVNREDVVVSSLESLVFPWVGSLEVKPPDGVNIQRLASSSDQAQLVNDTQYRFNGGDPDQLMKNFVPTGESYALAVRIRGKLKSNYPNALGDAPADKHLAESKTPANIVVIADVDFMTNRYSVASQRLFGAQIVSLLNDNQNFIENTVENLLGSDDLISVRSRGQFTRPFTRVEAMEIAAQQRFQQEELVWQSKLNSANQRLSQLQAAGESGDKQVFSTAMVEEIHRLRDEKKVAQRRLREVRRNLRQEIERLGTVLFVVNTFLVPLVLILLTATYYAGLRKKRT